MELTLPGVVKLRTANWQIRVRMFQTECLNEILKPFYHACFVYFAFFKLSAPVNVKIPQRILRIFAAMIFTETGGSDWKKLFEVWEVFCANSIKDSTKEAPWLQL